MDAPGAAQVGALQRRARQTDAEVRTLERQLAAAHAAHVAVVAAVGGGRGGEGGWGDGGVGDVVRELRAALRRVEERAKEAEARAAAAEAERVLGAAQSAAAQRQWQSVLQTRGQELLAAQVGCGGLGNESRLSESEWGQGCRGELGEAE